ncbi:MAG TPA: efflux RND transporter periplasmic adaptor subunit [Kofleriaceae bacterium]|nr:efflux RND transporter periplasmic adaptor subunit [Kofleriaceae bacterium]
MTPHTLYASLLAAAIAAAGPACKRSSGDGDLPPAKGAGAAERAALPDVKPPAEKTAATPTTDRTTGTTVPVDRAEVAPSMSAIISKIEVEEGDMVKKGQVLFRLRTTDLSLRVDQAQAGVKSAEVGVGSAKVEFDRMQRLLDKNAIERAQYDRAKAAYDSAKSAADQARVAVSLARRGLSDATVKSPISGVVAAVLKNEGEMATMMPPTVVVVVEDQSKLEVHFRMPEAALATIKEGAKIKATIEALGTTRDATVSRISPAVDPRTRTIEVIADLDNADRSLRSGMLVVVER